MLRVPRLQLRRTKLCGARLARRHHLHPHRLDGRRRRLAEGTCPSATAVIERSPPVHCALHTQLRIDTGSAPTAKAAYPVSELLAPANAPARKRRTFMGRLSTAWCMPACSCGPRLANGAPCLRRRLPCSPASRRGHCCAPAAGDAAACLQPQRGGFASSSKVHSAGHGGKGGCAEQAGSLTWLACALIYLPAPSDNALPAHLLLYIWDQVRHEGTGAQCVAPVRGHKPEKTALLIRSLFSTGLRSMNDAREELSQPLLPAERLVLHLCDSSFSGQQAPSETLQPSASLLFRTVTSL